MMSDVGSRSWVPWTLPSDMNEKRRGVATGIAIGLTLTGCAAVPVTVQTTLPPSTSVPPAPTGTGTLESPTGEIVGTVSLTPNAQSSS